MGGMTDNVKGALTMMAAMAFFTFNDACMKSLSDEIPFFQAIFLRGVASSLFLYLLARLMGALRFDLPRRDWWLIALRSAAEVAAAYFFITALFNMPIANATAILQALPLSVALAGAVFLAEPIGWRRILAILIGFVGVLLIIQPGADGFTVYSLYALATVAVVTVRDLASRRLGREVPSLTVAFVGAVSVAAFAGIGSIGEDWVMPPPRAAAQLAGAVVFLMGAYVFSVMTMRVGDIGVVAPFRYTGLLWALVLGVIVFGDLPDMLTLAGSALVVATGIFTLWRERQAGRRQRVAGLRIR